MFGFYEASRTLGRPAHLFLFKGADATLESMMRSVTIIPGATEFGYGINGVWDNGVPLNTLAGLPISDFQASIEELIAISPDLKHVSLVVAWHGTDLRVGNCQIKPKVEVASRSTTYEWTAGGLTRAGATVVSYSGGKPAIGGAPADRSIFEAIGHLKARGISVTLYPFVMMDIPAGNGLPDPYGGAEQAAYPWRGRITCHPAPGQPSTVDKTATAANQVANFFGTVGPDSIGWDAGNQRTTYSGPAGEWSLRRFILTMAEIGKRAGVDEFLIGSEFVGITQVRSGSNTYPGVSSLISLAAAVRTKMGSGVKLSYAADWSEYHSHRPADGTGDVFFNMDPLWSDSNINFVGVDNYLPLSDWRDAIGHRDLLAGYTSEYDTTYLRDNVEGGEYYDWYYASSNDRINQARTEINDGAEGKHWVFRQKDLRNWWLNEHYNRPGGVEDASSTSWVPESKPFKFTEVGCPAVHFGSNQPNVFIDAKSSESALPHFSNGRSDATIQRAYLETWLSYFSEVSSLNPESSVYAGCMVDASRTSIWTWDARPWPVFPERSDIWSDAANWQKGHWITGRVYHGRSFDAGDLGPFAYTDGEKQIVRDGIAYEPWPISYSDVVVSGSLDKSKLDIIMARGTPLDGLFSAYPPGQVVNLTIFKGHLSDEPTAVNYPAEWSGRIRGVSYNDKNEISFEGEPVSTSIRRPGLRRSYMIGCPHVLYGSDCKANKAAATTTMTVSSLGSDRIYFTSALPGAADLYVNGTVEWTRIDGRKEIRTLVRTEDAKQRVLIRGLVRALDPGDTVQVAFGCNRRMNHCKDVHDNIHNYGGQPWIPLENPFNFTSKFY